MLAIEIAVPLLYFAPRRLRNLACAATLALQGLIALTGNYTFFNLLTAALCLWLIDDHTWPRRIRDRFAEAQATWSGSLRSLAACAVALSLVCGTFLLSQNAFRLAWAWPSAVVRFYEASATFRWMNPYGLFAVMTRDRPEILVEGSEDGLAWKSYEFAFKPGDLRRRPPFVAPHQPRLDWQMWFAALGTARSNPWLLAFVRALLEGSAPVRGLLAVDPFPDAPPRLIRATLSDYRFTTPAERAGTGAWWVRSAPKEYLPPIGLWNLRK
jgi:hypothetical protein